LTHTFTESCVDFEVTHLSMHTHGLETAIPKDSYLNALLRHMPGYATSVEQLRHWS